MNNMWNCKYCHRQFSKDVNWETHQKCSFTESQMKALGATECNEYDTSNVANTQWFQHLMKIPGTNMLTCKKRRCIECYMSGNPIKFETRNGWQKHLARHHGDKPYEPKYKIIKTRSSKLEMIVGKEVQSYLLDIKDSIKQGKKISNIKVSITWDENASLDKTVGDPD